MVYFSVTQRLRNMKNNIREETHQRQFEAFKLLPQDFKAAITIQKVWRGYAVRQELKRKKSCNIDYSMLGAAISRKV